MNEEERREAYATAFIAQARSDWSAQRRLAEASDLAVCHQLHYLQMACEKLAKAYRLRDTASPVDEIVSHHTGFVKFVGAFLTGIGKDEYRDKDAQLTAVIKAARAFAREIEKLAPAIDRIASPENAEYPWERGEQIVAPRDYSFPNLDLQRGTGGRAFLNLVQRALDDFERTGKARLPA